MFDLNGPKTITNATEVQRDFARIIEKAQENDVIILRNNEPVAALISIKRLSSLNPSGQELPQGVLHFIKQIQKASSDIRNKIISVTLFGSYARGEADTDSDIDILVILKESNQQLEREISAWSTEAMASTNYADFLVTLCMTEKHWKQLKKNNVLLAQEIEKDGITLWKIS